MDVQRETFITVPALYIYRYVVGERGRLGNVNPILGVLCPNTVARKFRYVLLPRIINYAKTELNWDPPLGGSRRAPLLPPSSSNVRRTELENKRVSLNSLSFFEGGGRVRRELFEKVDVFLIGETRDLRVRGCSKRGKHGEPVGVPEGRVNEGNI